MQFDSRQVDSVNFCQGKFGTNPVLSFFPQPEADSRLRSTGTTGSLIRAGSRDRNQFQSVESCRGIELHLTHQTRIDDGTRRAAGVGEIEHGIDTAAGKVFGEDDFCVGGCTGEREGDSEDARERGSGHHEEDSKDLEGTETLWV